MRPAVDLDSLAYSALLDPDHRSGFIDAPRACASQVPGPNVLCGETTLFKSIVSLSDKPFNTFLSFYQVKPIYLLIAKVLHRQLHLRSFVALRVISSTSFTIIALVLGLWLARHFPPLIACVLALFISATAPILALGKSLLPDAFSDAMLLFVLYTILYVTSKLWLQISLLALLPLARIDNIVFMLVFGGVLLYRATPRANGAFLKVTVFVLGCFCYNSFLQHITHASSYTTLYSYTFLNWTLGSPSPRLLLSPYLRNEARNGALAILVNLPWALLFSTFSLINRRLWRPMKDLLLAALATCGLRLILFPLMEQRFYTWFLLIAVLSAAVSFGAKRMEMQPTSPSLGGVWPIAPNQA